MPQRENERSRGKEEKIIKLLEKLIMGVTELNAALAGLATSVTDLGTRISQLPGSVDLTAQVTQVNTLKAQVDALAPIAPPPVPKP